MYFVHQRQQLSAQLLKLRSDIVTKDPAAALVGACVLSGLTNATIKRIIENWSIIESAEQLQDYGVTSHEYAVLVLKVMSDFRNSLL